MNKQQIKKYTVEITKNDGMLSTYNVVALSAGGAEETALREVYAAKYAMATEGWRDGVTRHDLVSRGVANAAVDMMLS